MSLFDALLSAPFLLDCSLERYCKGRISIQLTEDGTHDIGRNK